MAASRSAFASAGVLGAPHFPPKAKRVIYLFQSGGPAQQELFDYKQAKVLLLSATPYKPFTLDQETLASGESHHQDFLQTLRFLNGDPAWLGEVEAALRQYREALQQSRSAGAAADRVRQLLITVMSRSERPRLRTGEMVREKRVDLAELTQDDVRGYVRLRELSVNWDPSGATRYCTCGCLILGMPS